MAIRHLPVAAGGGREIGVAQWGAEHGTPVLSLHGTPGSRFNRYHDEEALRAADIRLITYDRPGYGGSTRQPGRSVADCVADVACILNALDIERFAVTGASGGGPHALAVAAGFPERVTRARCIVGVAPYDAEGLDWAAGMDAENVKEFGRALEGETVLHDYLTEVAAADLARLAQDPTKVFSDDWHLDAADRDVLARADVQSVMSESLREAFRNGVWGFVDDDLAFLRPWGFELGDIRVPVEILYGEKDVLTPPTHGQWLAAHVPGARAIVSTTAGHMATPEVVLARLRSLAEPV